MSDPIIELARSHLPVDVAPLVQFGLKYTGVLANTPPDRIQRAVAEEVADLGRRAREALGALFARGHDGEVLREASDQLDRTAGLPRNEFEEVVARARATGAQPEVVAEIEVWIGKHRALENRVRWLLNGTPPHRRDKLDPVTDADELHHVVTSAFRFESRVLEMLAINRIAQSSTIGTFFRSTKEAEKNSVMRFFDTYSLYANVFEWGVDSLRGRSAIQRMNQIHGRYYIPNEGMKFVLVQGALTWLDGADRIAHRRVTDAERRAMLVAWVRMGRAMHITDISEDYDEMYGWYREVCASNRGHEPYKTEAFETIVGASLSGQMPPLRDGLFLAAKVAMDDDYRAAVGYPEPTREEKAAVRAVFFTVGSLIEQLPCAPYLRSLQNNPARRSWTDPHELGTPDRSVYMPKARPDSANGGFPEWQHPLRDASEAAPMELPEIPWDEVRRHTTDDSLWVVIDGYVYDLTTMVAVHPGGAKILGNLAGKDATRAFRAAAHSAGTLTFSLNYRIGRVVDAPAEPGT